jgi:hypothetical protein
VVGHHHHCDPGFRHDTNTMRQIDEHDLCDASLA